MPAAAAARLAAARIAPGSTRDAAALEHALPDAPSDAARPTVERAVTVGQHAPREPQRDPREPQPDPDLPTLRGLSLPRVADEDELYLARSLLTLPPQPLVPVIIPNPESVGPGERHRGELTLFIDETGAVVRVRAETSGLPAALEDAARRAFMAVRFAPGELTDLGAVKSRIRIEVVFDGGSALPT